jgi:hypothetical protein
MCNLNMNQEACVVKRSIFKLTTNLSGPHGIVTHVINSGCALGVGRLIVFIGHGSCEIIIPAAASVVAAVMRLVNGCASP